MLEGTLIYGFINSVILMLVALGFSVTFGISGVANFAYGALYVMTGFLSWLGLNALGLPYWIAAPAAVVITAAVAALIYWFILLRVRGLVVSEVIATFGVGLAILELFRYLGFIGFEYTLPPIIDASVMIGDTYVDAQRLCIVATGILLAAFLWFFTHYTKTGLAFRGIAQDERTALTLGINGDKVAALSVAFGAGYGALAALVILPLGTIAVNEGYNVLVNALAVCIVGGLGSTVGIIVASFLIGFAQILTATYLETSWMMLVSLVAILAILVIKPSGLFGHQKQLEERI
ncbi:MAG: branched-chain amino acid ABC transporter permease [Desulfarculaceae bacterium]|nr:branched-chain amino acid ABC transporter permease [Desulfarculaceae bacterium]MCF8048004.1 branched-chain amino acid ABC transporter permease [Desulfarculaceae bacterium]MCF8066250.1 branched-chain amino acid ABC transporter permease [Desulfarculaceae bacterium]MCF8098055.1 branched-chain amino acid ABC transporter permease [Desulfarculaceae bacterium]MCF8121014.1 branched-chain amino acid ABC transporter permease [Desulfarculaceae bacterium]